MLATLTLATALAVPSPVGPETRYDPRIPTLKQVTGHELGEEISSPDQIGAYLIALAAAAPDRARVVEYARSEEGRPLRVLVLGSPERLARLEAVQKELRALADPRSLPPAEADHSFAVRKRSGRTPEDVLAEVRAVLLGWLDRNGL